MQYYNQKHKDLTLELTKNFKKCVLEHDPGNDARLVRVLGELKMGFAFLETFRCDHVVTFFGSARTKERDPYYKKARGLANKLAKSGISILTGGGPGIMEAANRGALEGGGRSAGINIYLQNGARKNKYVREGFACYYFFNRKVLLAYAAEAYVFSPGGYGTLDEFFEICTLVATKKIDKNIPIILIGKSFWKPLIQWLETEAIEERRTLSRNELKIYTITDSVDEAFDIIRKVKHKIQRQEHL